MFQSVRVPAPFVAVTFTVRDPAAYAVTVPIIMLPVLVEAPNDPGVAREYTRTRSPTKMLKVDAVVKTLEPVPIVIDVARLS